MSEVVTHGLRQYVQAALARGDDPPEPPRARGGWPPPVPPPPTARAGRRAAARAPLLRAQRAAVRDAGRAERGGLAAAPARRGPRHQPAGGAGPGPPPGSGRAQGPRAWPRDVHCEPPPPFPQRRVASAAGLRPHLTIKIDHTLRASAHRAAADEGSSLTQVVEAILDRYLRHGMADGDQAPREAAGIAVRCGTRGSLAAQDEDHPPRVGRVDGQVGRRSRRSWPRR